MQTGRNSEGRRSAILTTTPNNSGTLIPPPSDSLEASGSGGSSPRKNRLSVATNNGEDAGKENTEGSYVATHEQGTPGQPSAVPDPSMSTVHPAPLSSISAPPSSGTSAERARFTEAPALSTEVSGHYPTICANPPDP